jgi:hypothetical protein
MPARCHCVHVSVVSDTKRGVAPDRAPGYRCVHIPLFNLQREEFLRGMEVSLFVAGALLADGGDLTGICMEEAIVFHHADVVHFDLTRYQCQPMGTDCR